MDDAWKTLFGDLASRDLEKLVRPESFPGQGLPVKAEQPDPLPAVPFEQELAALIGQEAAKKQLEAMQSRYRQQPPGHRHRQVIISGPRGSGKTRLADLVVRLWQDAAGTSRRLRLPHLALAGYESALKTIEQQFAQTQHEILVFEDGLMEEHQKLLTAILQHIVHQSKEGRPKRVILTIDRLDAHFEAGILQHHFLPAIQLGPWKLAGLEELITRETTDLGYTWEDTARSHLRERLQNLERQPSFANASSALHLLEEILHQHRCRVLETPAGKVIIYSDVTEDPDDRGSNPAPARNALEQKLQALETLVGMQQVKQHIKRLVAFIRVAKARGQSLKPQALHLVFTGNPGTGKTTVARLLAGIFAELKLLPSDHLVETERSQLVAGYTGQTAIKTRERLEAAMGGILFIDEAYTLHRGESEDAYGQEAIDTILKIMEDQREHLVVIIAGYTREMEIFLLSNPGLKSRFPITLDFADFTPAEIIEIAASQARQHQLKWGAGALEAFAQKIEAQRSEPGFANARSVRNLLEASLRQQAVRLMELGDPSGLDAELLHTLTVADISEGDRA